MKGVHSFLTPENIGKKFFDAKTYTKALTENYEEYERIARNRPHAKTPSEYPKTTDGTTASIIRKTPKRVVQQLPTGKIESTDDNSWLPIVAEFIYTHEILPYANIEYDLIQKCWNTIENGLTFGAKLTYTPFVNHGGHFSTDLVLPYWGDVFIQPGKKSGYACDYIFIRSWYQSEDIEAIIASEKQLKQSAKERGEKYEAGWDIEALESIKKAISSKDEEAKTPEEEEQNTDASGIEVVTGFQIGVGACFYTFHPSAGDKNGGEVKILRKKYNKDPRGKMPLDWFFGDVDGTNPLGRSLVDLLAGIQNLIDADMQMYQYNRALMLAPPLVKTGSFSKRKIVYKPNAVIDMGDDPNATLKPLDVDTSAVARYPELYGLQKSQLLNLAASPDTSISAEIGNPGFSKTDSGVKAQQANVSVDDNYIRKMFEAWFENWSETAVNLFFAERSGVEELQLDKKTADNLRKLADEGKFDASQLTEDNKLLIDYDTATPALKFRVDASTSKMKDDAEQGEILMNLIKGIDESPSLSQLLPPEKKLALFNRLVSNSGVEDPEELSVDIEEFMAQQQQAMEQEMMMAQQQEAAMAQEGMGMHQEGELLPPEAQLPPEMLQAPVEEPAQPVDPSQVAPEDAEIIQMLQDEGVPEQLIVEAIDLLDQGVSADEILASIQEVMSNA